jgi:hypothetical protein
LRRFSKPYPRRARRRHGGADAPETPVLRHFSLASGGIKTYSCGHRKMLFGKAPKLNTRRDLAARLSRKPQDLVFDSDLMTICC